MAGLVLLAPADDYAATRRDLGKRFEKKVAWARKKVAAGQGETDIFITPGYRFRVVDRLLTNFHLPKSTLMMLVSAFAGMAPIRAAYRHAIEQQYRFFSYGDAMLLEKSPDA